MKGFVKKLMVKGLALAIAASAFVPTCAFGEVDYKADAVIFESDFSSSGNVFDRGGNTLEIVADTDVNHGNALKITPAENNTDYKYSEKWIDNATESDSKMLSFDIKSPSKSQSMRFFAIDTANEQFMQFGLDGYGNLVFSVDGRFIGGVNQFKGDYKEQSWVKAVPIDEKWHTVDILNSVTDGNITVSYFVDGEKVCDANTSQASGANGKISRYMICTTKDGSGCGGTVDGKVWDENSVIYLDNLKCSYYKGAPESKNKLYAQAKEITGQNKVEVTFNETPLRNSITSAKVYDVGGNIISDETKTFEIQGRKLFVPLKADIDSQGECTVVLNDGIESVSGKFAATNAVTFDKAKKRFDTEPKPVTIYRFNNETADNTTYVQRADGDVAWIFSFDGNVKNDTNWFSTGNNSLNETDALVIAADMCSPGELSRTPNMRFATGDNGQNAAGLCFFDSYGNFVYAKDTTNISTDDKEASQYDTSKYGVYKMERKAGEWHRVRMTYTPSTLDIDYYVDDVYIGSGKAAAHMTYQVINFQATSANKSGTQTYIDNVAAGYGKANITVDELINTPENIVSGGKEAVTSTFDYGDDTRDYILSADISVDGPDAMLQLFANDTKTTLIEGKTTDVNEGYFYFWSGQAKWIGWNTTVGYQNERILKLGTEPTNIMFYVDRTAKKLVVYANGSPVVTNNLSSVYPPSFLKVGTKTGTTVNINNVKAGYMSSKTYVSKVRLNTADDSFSVYDANIPRNAKNVDLYFSEAVAGESATTENVKVKRNGTDVTVSNISYDTSSNKLSFAIDQAYLADGDYTVEINGIKAADGSALKTVTVPFKISGDDKFIISEFKLTDESGNEVAEGQRPTSGKVYLKASVTNVTEEKQPVLFVLTAYKDTILCNAMPKQIEVESGNTASVTTEVALDMSADVTEINGYIWSDFTHMIPYTNVIVR